MKKSILILALFSFSVVLVGCGGSKEDTTTTETTNTSSTTSTVSNQENKMFSIDACNTYVDVMTCVIKNSQDSVKKETQKSFDEVVSLRKSVSDEQLKSACEANIDALKNQKQVLENMGCSI